MKRQITTIKKHTAKTVNARLFIFVFLVTISIIMFSNFPGCSENPTTPTNPPTSTGSIGTLTVTPDLLTANTPDTLVAHLSAISGTYFTDSVAKLVKVDNSGNVISEIGVLYDNGLLANGDDIARDNIYSGKFIVTETSAGTIYLAAKGNVNSSGTNVSLTSTTVNITVYGALNSGQVGTILATQDNAATQLQTFLGGNPNNIGTASNQLKTWLESQPGVASVEKDGNTSMIINYTNGLMGGMVYSVEGIETRGGIESDSGRRTKLTKIPADRQTVGENFYGNSYRGNYTSDNSQLDPNLIGNRNVMVFAAYEGVWVNDERPLIINRLASAPCKEFKVTSFVDENANVSSLYNMTQFGYIVFSTHGSRGKAILTAEVVDSNSAIFRDSYNALLQAKRLALFKNVKVSTAGNVVTIANVYAVTNLFISNLAGTFPNTVILNNSCESTRNPDLANAFIGKGAKTYYGYDKVVNGAFAKTIADSITKRLAVTGLTTGNAFFAAVDPEVPNANFQLNAASNSNLKFSLSIVNGDFEEGNILGWTKEGDGRVINRLGTLTASQGSFMGIISTGLGFTTSSGSISQCFTVADNQSQLVMKWNFLSEEFLEYIHSQFQDYFKVIIRKSDGTEVTLLSKNIDQIAVQFGADTNQVGQLVAVSPGIVFDQGGVYMTNWQTSTFDVTPYRGQTIVVVLICGDVGDSIYDTAILIDEMKVN